MVKELSTLAKARPTTLDEKRRMERELGLDVEPSIVMPKSNRSSDREGVWKRLSRWLSGAPQ